jgi:hypothetical protein
MQFFMKDENMRIIRVLLLFVLLVHLSGCLLTKVATVPMRVTGAIISVVPVVGNSADDMIDGAADMVDEVPL